MKLLQLFLLSLATCHAFVTHSSFRAGTGLSLYSSSQPKPAYNRAQQRWEYTSDAQEPSAGYDTVGTLLRHGPKPFFNRVFDTDNYEQAILKFMAKEGCDRNEAQGNMDAYLRNPNDWAYYRNEEKKTGFRPDYVTLNKDQVVLTGTWGVSVTLILSRLAYCLATHTAFWDLPMLGLHPK